MTELENQFSQEFVVESYKTIVTDMNKMFGDVILPNVARDVNLVKVHRTDAVKGMTAPVAPNAESPIKNGEAQSAVSYAPLMFREKRLIGGDDLRMMINYQENMRTASQIFQENLASIAIRNKTRAEWMKWQACLGTLSVNENGVIATVDYDFPAGQFTNATVNWATIATAKPIEDIRTSIRVFKGSGYKAKYAVMNQTTADNLFANPDVRDQIKHINALTEVEAVKRYFSAMQLELVIYDEGYLDDSNVFQQFIPDDTVFLIGQDNATNGGIGELTMTLTPYGENIETPVSGYFGKMFMEKQDPPTASLVAGFYGLPALNSKRAVVVLTTHP